MSVDLERRLLADGASPAMVRVRQAFAALRLINVNVRVEKITHLLAGDRRMQARQIAKLIGEVDYKSTYETLGEMVANGLVVVEEDTQWQQGVIHYHRLQPQGFARVADAVRELADSLKAAA